MTLDEPVRIVAHDRRWREWYRSDAREIQAALSAEIRGMEHFGSTSVPGLAAKPIIDILLGPLRWPMADHVREALKSLGYEHLGEAGVPGREYFRRRGTHDTNLAVAEWNGPLWNDNLVLRDYLRAHPAVAAAYSLAKERAWAGGARTLLSYSAAKATHMAALLESARQWSAG